MINIHHYNKLCCQHQHNCHLKNLKIFDLKGSTWELVIHSYMTNMIYSLSMIMYIHQIVLRICLKSNRKLKTKIEKQLSNLFLIIQSKGTTNGAITVLPFRSTRYVHPFVGFVWLIILSLLVPLSFLCHIIFYLLFTAFDYLFDTFNKNVDIKFSAHNAFLKHLVVKYNLLVV